MTSRVVDIHRTRLNNIVTEAESIAGAWNRIAAQARQVLDHGGTLQVQDKAAFIVGGTFRFFKDIGVIEQLQADGVNARPKPRE
jgi:hypothetical protein